MGVAQTVDEEGIPVTDADVADLRAAVRGTVHDRNSFGYDDARELFNTAVEHRPGAIVTVAGSADIAATLALARRRQLSVSVRGGGHGVAGRATAGDLVIDLSALRGVIVRSDKRTATVRGGTLWSEFDAAAAAYHLATPGGRVGSTGVAGLTLGGGEGWLSPMHGLACDNLLAVELVSAAGERVVASPARERDLFWALRGAGANFGVVTSLTFRLHPVEPAVLGGMILFRLSDAAVVLGTLADLHELGDRHFAGAAAIMHAPAAGFVPGDVVGRAVLAVVPAFTGHPDDARPYLSRLRAAARPLADSVRPLSYLGLQKVFDATAPAGLRRAWGSTHIARLAPALVDDLESAGLPGPQSKIILMRFGGAVSTPPQDTALGVRAPSWLIHPAAQWRAQTDDARHRAWVRGLDERIGAASPTGTYLNLAEDQESRVRDAFGSERFARIAALKAHWDPDDVFHHCAHVPPARTGDSP